MIQKPILIPRPVTDESERTSGVDSDSPIFEAALAIAEQRVQSLKALRAAILKRDTPEVYRIAASLCGLGDCHETPSD